MWKFSYSNGIQPPLPPLFTTSIIPSVIQSLYLYSSDPVSSALAQKNRSSEISSAAKLPEELSTDSRDWFTHESLCHIRLAGRLVKCTLAEGKKENIWEYSGRQNHFPVQPRCFS